VPDLVGLEPRIELSVGSGGRESLQLTFQTLEDFHPDSLFTRLPIFEELRDAREAVQDGRPTPWGEDQGGAAGGAEGRTSAGRQLDAGEADSGTGDDAPSGVADVLDRILAESAARPDSSSTMGPDRELREFVQEIVEPHRVRPTPDRSAELAAIDEASGALMRHVTGQDAFRTLEALWRSVVFLLSRIDTSSKVRVYLIDVSRTELERTLAAADDPTRSRLYHLLSAPDLGPVATRWAVAIGAYTFCDSPADATLASRVARVAAAAGVAAAADLPDDS
jgi:type VI secretion system protein ImpC